jgi:hypothetical protein
MKIKELRNYGIEELKISLHSVQVSDSLIHFPDT